MAPALAAPWLRDGKLRALSGDVALNALSARSTHDDHSSLVTAIRVVISVLAFLIIFVCGLRLYLRHFVLRRFGLDDVLVFISLILALGYNAVTIALVSFGAGTHFEEVSPEHRLVYGKLYFAGMIIYIVVGFSIKLSLLVYLKDVFPKVVWLARTVNGIIVFMVLFAISAEFVLIFHCKPIRASWDVRVTDYKCFSDNAMFGIFLYQAVIMFLIDAAIFTMPIPILLKLHLPLKTRLILAFLFSFGLIACTAALIRFASLTFVTRENDTYLLAYSLICMNIEFNMALVAGSLPTLRILPGMSARIQTPSRRGSQQTDNTSPTNVSSSPAMSRMHSTYSPRKLARNWTGHGGQREGGVGEEAIMAASVALAGYTGHGDRQVGVEMATGEISGMEEEAEERAEGWWGA
ncbi:hypothetical protein AJ79_03225 [Helicocarpus griseus UAMH5409]|uniref:Rhodopsin domain-containing protein n=1 Tax=Helicocarpus griseus UAMH5409 TaxID=1447875 RepID=A0A2B7XZX0_9EURO|nr:hypothetical protein AJ79_03225 [Helicocarpus griseus UAMH5409]